MDIWTSDATKTIAAAEMSPFIVFACRFVVNIIIVRIGYQLFNTMTIIYTHLQWLRYSDGDCNSILPKQPASPAILPMFDASNALQSKCIQLLLLFLFLVFTFLFRVIVCAPKNCLQVNNP
jgi:hypothetical protein